MDRHENYLFKFDTLREADYWLGQVFNKFRSDVVKINRYQQSIDFPEATYYFWTDRQSEKRWIKNVKQLPIGALYIILDDPERNMDRNWIPDEEV